MTHRPHQTNAGDQKTAAKTEVRVRLRVKPIIEELSRIGAQPKLAPRIKKFEQLGAGPKSAKAFDKAYAAQSAQREHGLNVALGETLALFFQENNCDQPERDALLRYLNTILVAKHGGERDNRTTVSETERATALLNELLDLRKRDPAAAAIIEKRLATEFTRRAATSAPTPRSLPSKAPEKWTKRPGAGETAIGFLRRVYGAWLPAPLGIATLSGLDHDLYANLKQWAGRNPVPRDLRKFFSERVRRSSAEVEAELRKYKIENPADAFARFPNDRKLANRLYQAAMARISKPSPS